MPRPPKQPLCSKKCGVATRHKSGVCEACRKKSRKECANYYCKKAVYSGDLCTKHYKYMLRREEVFGIKIDGTCEVLDSEFDEILY